MVVLKGEMDIDSSWCPEEDADAEDVCAANAEGVGDEVIDNEESSEVESKEASTNTGIIADIAAAERECARAELEVGRCKAALKSAKADYDECVAGLRELARSLANDSARPMMAMFEKAENTSDDLGQDPDSWRLAPISELGFQAGLLSKLAEAGIETIGQLEDLRSEISLGREEWPKGIGPAKITLIEDRVCEWLGDWAAKQESVTDDHDDDEEEDGEEAED